MTVRCASSAALSVPRTSRSPRPSQRTGRQRIRQGADGLAPLSEKLVAELTAYRTSALRNELAQHPATALLALVHALALATFFQGSEGSCLEITPKSAWLSGHAPGIDESVAEQQIAERHAAWAKRLPRESEELWTFIHGLSDDERMSLLAHCVSLTRQCDSRSRRQCRTSPKPMPPFLPAKSGST